MQLNINKSKKENKELFYHLKNVNLTQKNNNNNIRKEFFGKEKNNYSKKRTNNKDKNKSINIINKKITINSRNRNYSNYCKSLCKKTKSKYSNKISLNKIKIYKFNNIPINITEQISKKSNNKNKESTIFKKSFSLKKLKSKKCSKDNDQDLKEMYLKAGSIKNN